MKRQNQKYHDDDCSEGQCELEPDEDRNPYRKTRHGPIVKCVCCTVILVIFLIWLMSGTAHSLDPFWA